MNLADRLQKAVQGVPDEGAITLPAGVLRQWIQEADGGPSEGAAEGRGEPVADLTVPELADELGRSESTVRGWLPDVDGAYKLGSEWRVPRDAWRRHLNNLADDGDDGPPEVRSSASASLEDWRQER